LESIELKENYGVGKLFFELICQINEQRGFCSDRVSAYETAISGKMPDANVFKGVQTI